MKKINIYAYVRSNNSDESRVNSQMRSIENYCNEHFPGSKISWFIDRNYSGISPVNDRPAYMKMCKAIQPEEMNICIVEDLTRISRNNVELAIAVDGLVKNNVSLFTTLGQLNSHYLDFIRYIGCMPNQRYIKEDIRNSIRKEI